MRKLVLKRLPLAIMILMGQSFEITAIAQDFSLQYDWNLNEEYQEWWDSATGYGSVDDFMGNRIQISSIDPINELQIGQTILAPSTNLTPISLSQSTTIDLNVLLSARLHIENTSQIYDNHHGDWIIDYMLWEEGQDPNLGSSLTFVNLFAKTAELLVSQIGLLSYGTEVTNNSDISISSDVQGKISAYSTMNLTSDNKTPTDEELAQVHAPDFDSFNWELNVATIAAAGLSASGGGD